MVTPHHRNEQCSEGLQVQVRLGGDLVEREGGEVGVVGDVGGLRPLI